MSNSDGGRNTYKVGEKEEVMWGELECFSKQSG